MKSLPFLKRACLLKEHEFGPEAIILFPPLNLEMCIPSWAKIMLL